MPRTKKVDLVRSGVAAKDHYEQPDRSLRTEYSLVLDWIPVAKKSRFHATYNQKLKRVLQFPDRLVELDTKAIQGILARDGSRCTDHKAAQHGAWELAIEVRRPMSKAESKRGTPNKRRGDTVSAHELVCDALSGFWYQDDSQVTKLTIEERRGFDKPGLLVTGWAR